MTVAPIGRLSTRLVLERESRAADDSVVWLPAATLYGALAPVSADEAERGAGLGGRARWRIEIRRRTDLSGRDRLRAGARVFRILTVRDADPRRGRLEVLAEEEEP